jgi:hypothetical protein
VNPPSRPPRQPRRPREPRVSAPTAHPATHSPLSRERALGLLRRCNRFVIGAAVALTALLAEVAAQAFPGKTLAASNGAASHSRSRGGEASGSSTTPLQPPAEAPQESTTTPTEPSAEGSQQGSETAPQSSEQAPQSSEVPQTSEPQASSEAPAAPQSTEETPAPETAPPVVSGGS